MKKILNPLNIFSLIYVIVAFYAIISVVSYFPHKKTNLQNSKLFNKTFDFSSLQWQQGETRYSSSDLQIGEFFTYGNISNSSKELYSQKMLTFKPEYTIIENAYLGPDGFIYKDNSYFPKKSRYNSHIFVNKTNFSIPQNNLRKFDKAIALPVFDLDSDPLIYTLILPMLSSLPYDIRSDRRLLINRPISDLEIVLERNGMDQNSAVYTQNGWTFAKNLVIFKEPSTDFIDYSYVKHFSDSISRSRYEMIKNDKNSDFQNKIFFLGGGYDPNNLMAKILPNIQELTSRVEIYNPVCKMEERIEDFRKMKALISFDSDDLHLIYFMPHDAVIIIIQQPTDLLKHVMIAKESGHNVHIVSTEEQNIEKTIIKILASAKML